MFLFLFVCIGIFDVDENGLDLYNSSNDPNRFNQLNHQRASQNQHQQQQQQQSQQNNLHSSDNLSQQLYASNLTKFFDFHKNQQQQQQYQQQQLFFNDQLNLIDPSRRMDSQYLEQQNSQNGNIFLQNIFFCLFYFHCQN